MARPVIASNSPKCSTTHKQLAGYMCAYALAAAVVPMLEAASSWAVTLVVAWAREIRDPRSERLDLAHETVPDGCVAGGVAEITDVDDSIEGGAAARGAERHRIDNLRGLRHLPVVRGARAVAGCLAHVTDEHDRGGVARRGGDTPGLRP